MSIRIPFPCRFWFVLFLFAGSLYAEEAKKITADKDRIIKTVRFLSEENFPRTAAAKNKEITIDYLIKSMAEAGLTAARSNTVVMWVVGDDLLDSSVPQEEKIAFEFRRYPFVNISALKKGKTDKRIVAAAHYDAIPDSPAADDNASGNCLFSC